MNKYNLLLIFSLVSIYGCTQQKENIESYNLDAYLSGIVAENDSTHLVNLNPKKMIDASWDSIIIVKPYLVLKKLERLNLTNLSSIKSTLETTILQDNKASFLFVNREKIIGYAIVLLMPIDFTSLKDEIPIIRRSESERLFLKQKHYKGETYYIVVEQ